MTNIDQNQNQLKPVVCRGPASGVNLRNVFHKESAGRPVTNTDPHIGDAVKPHIADALVDLTGATDAHALPPPPLLQRLHA